MSAEFAIETTALAKRFRRRAAVAGIDLAVPVGSVFGFLGPNGSGKTTTIRMLLGLIAPSSGEARLFGEAMPDAGARVLPRVGALVEGPGFAPYLSGRANLARLDAADRRSSAGRAVRIADALDRVGLTAAADRHVRGYSLGMKQRLGLACALLRPRDLLVLDEPTNGLDPQGTREVRALIRSLAGDGTTVFVSSHLLAEIEQLSSHVGVMSAGRLVAQDTLDALRGGGIVRVRVDTPDVALAEVVLAKLGLAVDTSAPAPSAGAKEAVLATAALATAGAATPEPERIVSALVAAGVRVRGFRHGTPSLEERFVELTGEGFDVGA